MPLRLPVPLVLLAKAKHNTHATIRMCSSAMHRPSLSRRSNDVIGDSFTRRSFGSYIENYYTTNHAATGFSSPLRKTFVFVVFVFQAVFTFGYLFHTNYYFTGKALPKPDSSTQLTWRSPTRQDRRSKPCLRPMPQIHG
ncbi:hypothetical protein, conserved [Babesia bigemina]|uniref:Uncharacterized protein n=1 Tax=Babesia bigemina TaxID=5866 RepID=A0A061D492_BABBI|nr:hypothetical protein, conserved [Babesia bigemina]CDR95393.1 hypothetical protein, conserved [Babesia bigemina]|eukprot:XP_012767579.1 hypothetical protein, conserved [Babesia bigemina]